MHDVSRISCDSAPGFGQSIDNTLSLDWHELIKKVAFVVLKIIVSAEIGLLLTGSGMAALFTTCGVASIFLLEELLQFSNFLISSFKHPTIIKEQEIHNPKAPSLGSYSTADVIVINNVEETFEWKLNLIRSAKCSIELSANFAGGKAFQDVLDEIENQLRNKNQLYVHLLLSKDLLEKKDIERLNELKKEHPKRFVFLATPVFISFHPLLHSEENHVKLLVVDEKYFVVGGSGICPKMVNEKKPAPPSSTETFAMSLLHRSFRDTDMIGCGPIAGTMRNQFFALYQKWEKREKNTKDCPSRFFPLTENEKGHCGQFHTQEEELLSQVKIKCLVGGSEHWRNNPITSEYAERVRASKKEICMASLMFKPDKRIQQAMRTAKKRNVDIKGYFGGTTRDSGFSRRFYIVGSRPYYDLFTTAFEYQSPPLLHKKVATFDETHAIIGSYNLGPKSAYFDDEIVCVMEDSRVARKINDSLEEDGRQSIEKKAERFSVEGLLAGLFYVFF